jgi:CUB domain
MTFATDTDVDIVTIYDGNSADSRIIAVLSGQLQTPLIFTTTQQYMFVEFVSDNQQSGLNGFQATYSSISRNSFEWTEW